MASRYKGEHEDEDDDEEEDVVGGAEARRLKFGMETALLAMFVRSLGGLCSTTPNTKVFTYDFDNITVLQLAHVSSTIFRYVYLRF
ncbi:hypothetical protein LSAT2_031040 [Lamellibrachia satsuma]|nr:hypothetical protein LSAT2_031040 [Lamellibrachia satsuma]